MGQDHSRETHAKVYDSFSYSPITTHRTEARYTARFQGQCLFTQSANEAAGPLLKVAYFGIWSMRTPNSVCPIPRVGQCAVYDPLTDSLIIAYGQSASGVLLNDAWALNLLDLKWRRVHDTLLSARKYPSSVLIGRKMYIFGGASEGLFFSDLHSLDLDTGLLSVIETRGELPDPRASPALIASESQLFLWSGWSGRSHGESHHIRLDDCEWRRYEHLDTGVPAPATCYHKGKHYCYGGMSGTPMVVFHPEDGRFAPLPCIGTEPPSDLSHASLVSADDFIFLMGGESQFPHVHVYALDVERQWWFAFHVRPDGDTLQASDGFVNRQGLFMLPMEHSASIVYSPRERQLVCVMGSKMIDPPPVFLLSIGECLGVLHVRTDMREMFKIDVLGLKRGEDPKR
jgi:hypothetical protein